MYFNFGIREKWPPLAWVVELRPGRDVIAVHHGPAVEIRPDWFSECVWDGHFAEGGFDQTDIVAGTGGRIRDRSLCLVSSGSTVDRLQHVFHEGSFWVSNSAVCLMATLDGSFDATYPNYPNDFTSIIRGLNSYVSSVPSNLGPVSLVYFDNLRWNGRRLERESKPEQARDFQSFDSYHVFLKSSLEQISINMRDSAREFGYEFQGTLSTGYDSTTITALARPFGLSEVICFETPDSTDRGSQIAHYLGVEPKLHIAESYCDLQSPEPAFLSVNGYGEEVHFRSAESDLIGRVLLTGYHGDKVWGIDNPDLGPEIVRGDLSGLALSEYRLWARFINCAVPFWGIRQIAQINQISRDPSMSRWDIGGNYTRPICRRIVETSGVPREAFGQTKSHASQWFVLETKNLTEDSEKAFFNYLRVHRGEWWKRFRIPPTLNRDRDNALLGALHKLAGALTKLPGWYRLGFNGLPILGNLTALGNRKPNPPYAPMVVGTRRYYFPWAVEHCKKRYE